MTGPPEIERPAIELIPLGTNGFFPSYGRQTMSFLLLLDDRRAVLLDAGTGVARLAETAIATRLANFESLDIVLGHYHLDHVVGLTYLSTVWGRPARIHAPAPPLVDVEPAIALGRLVGPPLFPIALDRFPVPIEVRAYSGSFELAGRTVGVRRQNHPGGSVALRIDDALAYVTDTVADPESATFAHGVDLLLHEVWASDEEARAKPFLVAGHAAVGPVLEIAERASVSRLMPVHHHPSRTPDELAAFLAEVCRRSPVEVIIAEEGRSRVALRT